MTFHTTAQYSTRVFDMLRRDNTTAQCSTRVFDMIRRDMTLYTPLMS